MIDMNGLDWASGPEGGIYLMGRETSAAEVARGGGGMLGSQKVRGWGGGKLIPGDVKTSAEAIVTAGLDWVVDRRPILQVDPVYGVPTPENPSGINGWETRESAFGNRNGLPTGGFSVAPDHVMNVRRDTGSVLGVVGKNWRGPQNDEIFSFVDSLVDDGDAKWLAGGSQDGGKRVWMCAQIARSVAIGGDVDEMCVPLMFVSNGWDGGSAYSVTVAPYKLACFNGQTIPLVGYVRNWRARHTSGLVAEKRIKEARKTLDLSIGYFDAWSEEMERLLTKPMSITAVRAGIKILLPDPKPKGDDGNLTDRQILFVERKREILWDVYSNSPTLQNHGQTAYRFLDAVTEFADWYQKVDEDKAALRSAEPSKLKDDAYRLAAA